MTLWITPTETFQLNLFYDYTHYQQYCWQRWRCFYCVKINVKETVWIGCE